MHFSKRVRFSTFDPNRESSGLEMTLRPSISPHMEPISGAPWRPPVVSEGGMVPFDGSYALPSAMYPSGTGHPSSGRPPGIDTEGGRKRSLHELRKHAQIMTLNRAILALLTRNWTRYGPFLTPGTSGPLQYGPWRVPSWHPLMGHMHTLPLSCGLDMRPAIVVP